MPRLIATVVFMVGVAAGVSAQSGQRTIRFAGMDTNSDGVITRREWRGSPRAFDVQDWNGDGILSGEEVRPRGGERNARDRSDEFDEWTTGGFARLDRNNDRRITRDEWPFDPETFRRADDDGDGAVSRAEFMGELDPDVQAGGDRPYSDTNNDGRLSRSEWQGTAERFNLLDANGDGELTARELSRGNRAEPDAFRVMDANRDGTVTRDEWRGALAGFQRRDTNGDGRLTRQEFGTAADRQTADRPTTTEAWRQGHERGLVEGRQAGKEDKDRNQGWDLDGQRELESADSGYDARFGPKTEYQAGYRDGFRRGYREGWGPH